MIAVTEAAKSRTPMVVLAPDTGAAGARSNFRLDQASLAAGIGAVYERVATPDGAVDDVVRAVRRARAERRTVILGLPLDVQAAECAAPAPRPLPADPVVEPAPEAVAQLAAVLETAERPVFIAGRGARPDAAHGDAARDAIAELAAASGALLATSAVAKGLFAGDPWYLDVSGGFASPLAAELITAADLVVAWGCTLNMWTTRHGSRCDRGGATRGGAPGEVPPAGGARAHRPRGPLAGRAVRRREHRQRDRPADVVDRAGRRAAGRAGGGRRLGQLHGVPVDVPVGARRRRVLLHAGVPVDRAGPGHGGGRRAGAARPAAGRRARRRRVSDGRRRAGDRGTPRAADARGGVQRRRVRRRGAPFRPGGPPAGDGLLPGHRSRRDRARLRLRRRDGTHEGRSRRGTQLARRSTRASARG